MLVFKTSILKENLALRTWISSSVILFSPAAHVRLRFAAAFGLLRFWIIDFVVVCANLCLLRGFLSLAVSYFEFFFVFFPHNF